MDKVSCSKPVSSIGDLPILKLFLGSSGSVSVVGVSKGFSSFISFPFSASEIDEVEESLLLSDPEDVSPVLESLPDDCFRSSDSGWFSLRDDAT